MSNGGSNGHGSNGNGNDKRRANGKHNIPLSRKEQHAAPKDVDDELLRVMALQLRRDGASYRTIAAAMTTELQKQGHDRKVDKNTAHRLVVEALTDLRETNAESAEQVKQIELERFDIWLQRLSTSKNAGSPRTIDTMLRVSEARRRLLGVDAPKKIGIGGIDGGPIALELTDARSAVRARLEGLRKALGSQPAEVVAAPQQQVTDGKRSA